MSTVPDLLAKIDAYLADTGVAETTFGRLAVNDGKFVSRLRGGSGITVAMVDRVHAYINRERAKMTAASSTTTKEPPARPTRRARGPGFRKAA